MHRSFHKICIPLLILASLFVHLIDCEFSNGTGDVKEIHNFHQVKVIHGSGQGVVRKTGKSIDDCARLCLYEKTIHCQYFKFLNSTKTCLLSETNKHVTDKAEEDVLDGKNEIIKEEAKDEALKNLMDEYKQLKARVDKMEEEKSETQISSGKSEAAMNNHKAIMILAKAVLHLKKQSKAMNTKLTDIHSQQARLTEDISNLHKVDLTAKANKRLTYIRKISKLMAAEVDSMEGFKDKIDKEIEKVEEDEGVIEREMESLSKRVEAVPIEMQEYVENAVKNSISKALRDMSRDQTHLETKLEKMRTLLFNLTKVVIDNRKSSISEENKISALQDSIEGIGHTLKAESNGKISGNQAASIKAMNESLQTLHHQYNTMNAGFQANKNIWKSLLNHFNKMKDSSDVLLSQVSETAKMTKSLLRDLENVKYEQKKNDNQVKQQFESIESAVIVALTKMKKKQTALSLTLDGYSKSVTDLAKRIAASWLNQKSTDRVLSIMNKSLKHLQQKIKHMPSKKVKKTSKDSFTGSQYSDSLYDGYNGDDEESHLKHPRLERDGTSRNNGGLAVNHKTASINSNLSRNKRSKMPDEFFQKYKKKWLKRYGEKRLKALWKFYKKRGLPDRTKDIGFRSRLYTSIYNRYPRYKGSPFGCKKIYRGRYVSSSCVTKRSAEDDQTGQKNREFNRTKLSRRKRSKMPDEFFQKYKKIWGKRYGEKRLRMLAQSRWEFNQRIKSKAYRKQKSQVKMVKRKIFKVYAKRLKALRKFYKKRGLPDRTKDIGFRSRLYTSIYNRFTRYKGSPFGCKKIYRGKYVSLSCVTKRSAEDDQTGRKKREFNRTKLSRRKRSKMPNEFFQKYKKRWLKRYGEKRLKALWKFYKKRGLPDRTKDIGFRSRSYTSIYNRYPRYKGSPFGCKKIYRGRYVSSSCVTKRSAEDDQTGQKTREFNRTKLSRRKRSKMPDEFFQKYKKIWGKRYGEKRLRMLAQSRWEFNQRIKSKAYRKQKSQVKMVKRKIFKVYAKRLKALRKFYKKRGLLDRTKDIGFRSRLYTSIYNRFTRYKGSPFGCKKIYRGRYVSLSCVTKRSAEDDQTGRKKREFNHTKLSRRKRSKMPNEFFQKYKKRWLKRYGEKRLTALWKFYKKRGLPDRTKDIGFRSRSYTSIYNRYPRYKGSPFGCKKIYRGRYVSSSCVTKRSAEDDQTGRKNGEFNRTKLSRRKRSKMPDEFFQKYKKIWGKRYGEKRLRMLAQSRWEFNQRIKSKAYRKQKSQVKMVKRKIFKVYAKRLKALRKFYKKRGLPDRTKDIGFRSRLYTSIYNRYTRYKGSPFGCKKIYRGRYVSLSCVTKRSAEDDQTGNKNGEFIHTKLSRRKRVPDYLYQHILRMAKNAYNKRHLLPELMRRNLRYLRLIKRAAKDHQGSDKNGEFNRIKLSRSKRSKMPDEFFQKYKKIWGKRYGEKRLRMLAQSRWEFNQRIKSKAYRKQKSQVKMVKRKIFKVYAKRLKALRKFYKKRGLPDRTKDIGFRSRLYTSIYNRFTRYKGSPFGCKKIYRGKYVSLSCVTKRSAEDNQTGRKNREFNRTKLSRKKRSKMPDEFFQKYKKIWGKRYGEKRLRMLAQSRWEFNQRIKSKAYRKQKSQVKMVKRKIFKVYAKRLKALRKFYKKRGLPDRTKDIGFRSRLYTSIYNRYTRYKGSPFGCKKIYRGKYVSLSCVTKRSAEDDQTGDENGEFIHTKLSRRKRVPDYLYQHILRMAKNAYNKRHLLPELMRRNLRYLRLIKRAAKDHQGSDKNGEFNRTKLSRSKRSKMPDEFFQKYKKIWGKRYGEKRLRMLAKSRWEFNQRIKSKAYRKQKSQVKMVKRKIFKVYAKRLKALRKFYKKRGLPDRTKDIGFRSRLYSSIYNRYTRYKGSPFGCKKIYRGGYVSLSCVTK